MISEVTTTVVHVERITGVSGFIEAVFSALVQAIPDQLFAAPAGTSGNFCLGGYDPKRERSYVMYVISGGGYGGNPKEDGLSNGCSTIGISKTTPIEVMEQYYPVLFEEYSLHEGSSVSQKFADLLLTTESMVLTGNDLLNKCGLKPNMIVKASESRLVKPILQNRGWKRKKSMEYLGYGRGYLLVRG